MKLSRSKIDLFLRCSRCFWLDVNADVKQPPSAPYTLNLAVDHLFKKEFDAYRGGTVVPPRLQKEGIACFPAAHPQFEDWRSNRKGVSFMHPATGFELYGIIDDLWVDTEGTYFVADYKATSKAGEVSLDSPWQIAYKRQMEFYQWLLRQNGLRVSDRAWFVYTNAKKDAAAFNDVLHFHTKLIPYDGSDAWVGPTLLEAQRCLAKKSAPAADKKCPHCAYVKAASVAAPPKSTGNMPDIFEIEPSTKVPREGSYIRSYPEILSYFAQKPTINVTDLVCGAHMVYGWMPTVLDLYPSESNLDLGAGAELLTRAKQTGVLADQEIASLAALVNNSLVGASKLLHFVAPHAFAIWDSKIYTFVFGNKPHNYRVNDLTAYRRYLDKLADIQADPRFSEFHASVNEKVGYPVSPLRAIELVMFLNAPVVPG